MFSLHSIYKYMTTPPSDLEIFLKGDYSLVRGRVSAEWASEYKYSPGEDRLQIIGKIVLIASKHSISYKCARTIYNSIIDGEDTEELLAPYSAVNKLRNVFIGVAIDVVIYPLLYSMYSTTFNILDISDSALVEVPETSDVSELVGVVESS